MDNLFRSLRIRQNLSNVLNALRHVHDLKRLDVTESVLQQHSQALLENRTSLPDCLLILFRIFKNTCDSPFNMRVNGRRSIVP